MSASQREVKADVSRLRSEAGGQPLRAAVAALEEARKECLQLRLALARVRHRAVVEDFDVEAEIEAVTEQPAAEENPATVLASSLDSSATSATVSTLELPSSDSPPSWQEALAASTSLVAIRRRKGATHRRATDDDSLKDMIEEAESQSERPTPSIALCAGAQDGMLRLPRVAR